ncbi:hypothetical protein [Microbispora sp. H11081]|uniref:hypothetical protein n=1 Tax=Microbispora sp. H11081 TaxID=2729107 RepID=UPI00147604C1|nr:hypothetical protein [Microbispora sp. H11081]
MVRTRHGGMLAGIVAATVLLAVPPSSGAAAPDAAPGAVDVSGAAGGRPIDCRDWAWPQAHTVRNTKPVYSLGKWGGAVDVTLWRGDAGPRGEWHYWAALTGRTRPGDAVWLEVWPPGGGP